MAKKKPAQAAAETQISDLRHKSIKRKNIPPAKIAAEGVVPLMGKVEYDYSPRRPPELRFDADGEADRLPELLQQADTGAVAGVGRQTRVAGRRLHGRSRRSADP